MTLNLWAESTNGPIQYKSITQEYQNQALEVMRNTFFVDELVSKALDLHKHPAARSELDGLSLRAMNDGLSMVAVEKSTDNVVGVVLNKLQISNSDQMEYFENYIKLCKHASSKALVQFMIDADESCDLFELCDVDCMMEVAVDAAKQLKMSANSDPLPLKPVPKIVSAIFTSPVSQSMGRGLGFRIAKEVSYERFSFGGRKFSESIGSQMRATTVEYLVI